ncbi:MAG: hypothetical protein IT233_04270 [Bacteroidia bacterium]|nr:hypothetical protein [Bacteroidia bacterium]
MAVTPLPLPVPDPNPSSCIDKEPFIKLDPDGQASILNYKLPDSTCFDSSGYIKLNVNPACFKPETNNPPVGNLFDVLSELPASQITQLVNDALLGGSPNPLFVNSFYLSQQPVISSIATKSEVRGDTLRTSVKENEDATISDINLSEIVNQSVKGKRPIIRRNLWGRPVIHFMPRPKTPKPTIVLVLHYKTCSFLGDYGAGKTVKTFSLLPGEKTFISIRSYRHFEEMRKRSECVLDSFSESSAQTLENIIENQNGHDETTSTVNPYPGFLRQGYWGDLNQLSAAAKKDATWKMARAYFWLQQEGKVKNPPYVVRLEAGKQTTFIFNEKNIVEYYKKNKLPDDVPLYDWKAKGKKK